MELRPEACSIIRSLKEYRFRDEQWMDRRTRRYGESLNIYELHLGSWTKPAAFAAMQETGEAAELMELIDRLHLAGIGAIMDFVPVHFAVDAYGLKEYDGTSLYEYPHPDVGESEWGSCNFNHSRGEVASFLQSAANYWLKEYHFDGLRMDAVSRLIYWQGDEKRGRTELP